jgi:hypothetical protein
MPERIKLSIKLTIEMDAGLDQEDTLEILKENLENFQYTIGVRRIDIKMDKPKPLNEYSDLPRSIVQDYIRKEVVHRLTSGLAHVKNR